MSSAGAARSVAIGVARTARTARTSSVPARLRVVATPEHLRSRAGLVTACLGLLAVGLIGLLILTVSLGRGAYQMRALRAEKANLVEQRQALQEEIAALQAPQSLAAKARTQGMVPAPNVAVIRRSDGTVLGEPKAAAGVPLPIRRHPGPGSSPTTIPSPGASGGPTPGVAAAVPAATPAATRALTTATKPTAIKPTATSTATPVTKPTTKPATAAAG